MLTTLPRSSHRTWLLSSKSNPLHKSVDGVHPGYFQLAPLVAEYNACNAVFWVGTATKENWLEIKSTRGDKQ